MIESVVHGAGSSFRFWTCDVQHSGALTLICSSLMLWQCTYKNLSSPKQVTVSGLVRKKCPQKQGLSLVPVPRALVCNLHLLPGFLMEVQRNGSYFPGPKADPHGQHRGVVLPRFPEKRFGPWDSLRNRHPYFGYLDWARLQDLFRSAVSALESSSKWMWQPERVQGGCAKSLGYVEKYASQRQSWSSICLAYWWSQQMACW